MTLHQLRRAYELMHTSRAIDDACDELMAQGHPVPNYHGSRGQEALYAGVGVALRAEDYLLFNYRAFATLLAKGVGLAELVGDLMMNQAGTTRGHGGIMHVHDRQRGLVGRNGVFGSKFGIALGLAQELVLSGREGAVACMFGEAEGGRGALYEAINIALLRRLPIVFFAENNGFAVAATTDVLYATGDMSSIWSADALPVHKVDGNSISAVITAADMALNRARSGEGPSFVELVTARIDPHHAHDDQTVYRPAAQIQHAWDIEPIRRARELLAQSGVTQEELETMEADAKAAVDKAVTETVHAAGAEMTPVYEGVWREREGR